MTTSDAFPVYAQQLYGNPVDATGKVACSSCHLAEGPIRISGPRSVFPASIFDLVLEVPVNRAVEQVTASGDRGPLNVGGLLVLPEGIRKVDGADSSVFTEFSSDVPSAYVFGPQPATLYATSAVRLQVGTEVEPLSYSVIVAGNRGRGQLYPDGSPSNNSSFRSTWSGWISRVKIARESVTVLGFNAKAELLASRLPTGVAIVPGATNQFAALVSEDSVLIPNPNVGGLGQTESILVVQDPSRLIYLGLVIASIAITQLALVIKKKQYERYRFS